MRSGKLLRKNLVEGGAKLRQIFRLKKITVIKVSNFLVVDLRHDQRHHRF